MEQVEYREEMMHKKCKQKYTYQLDYLKEFYEQYGRVGVPRFSFTWITDPSHDDINRLYHADSYLSAYFLQNKHLFDNSFIIIMSDHGMHYGAITETEVSSYCILRK